jgi:hypothetical protein
MDTLKTARRLGAQFNREQAEAIAEAVAQSQEEAVTKSHLDGRLAEFKADVKIDLARLETAMLWKIGGMILLSILLQIGAQFALKCIR